jgi:hypothetical protein
MNKPHAGTLPRMSAGDAGATGRQQHRADSSVSDARVANATPLQEIARATGRRGRPKKKNVYAGLGPFLYRGKNVLPMLLSPASFVNRHGKTAQLRRGQPLYWSDWRLGMLLAHVAHYQIGGFGKRPERPWSWPARCEALRWLADRRLFERVVGRPASYQALLRQYWHAKATARAVRFAVAMYPEAEGRI